MGFTKAAVEELGSLHAEPDWLRASRRHAFDVFVRPHLFTEVTPERDKLAALHGALFSGGTFLYVPPGVAVEKPFVSQFWSSGGGAAVLPHTLVIAGEGSAFNYVDEFLSPDLD